MKQNRYIKKDEQPFGVHPFWFRLFYLRKPLIISSSASSEVIPKVQSLMI